MAKARTARFCTRNILGDLIRARSISAAARESVTETAKTETVLDKDLYIGALESAVTSLDTAIALAEKNLPKAVPPVNEEVPFNV
jgi:hypothetical protein